MVLGAERREKILNIFQEQREVEAFESRFVEAQKKLTNFVLIHVDFGSNDRYLNEIWRVEKNFLIALESQDNSELKVFFFSYEFENTTNVLQVCTTGQEGSPLLCKKVDVDSKKGLIYAKLIDDDTDLKDVGLNVSTIAYPGCDFVNGSHHGKTVSIVLKGETISWNVEWNANDDDNKIEEVKEFKEQFINIVNDIVE